MPKWLKDRSDISEMLSFGEPHISNCHDEITTELELAKSMRTLGMGQHSTDEELKICVEALTYIEAHRAEKGWWFRARKRVALTKKYLVDT